MKLHLTIDSGTLAGQSYDLETGFMTIGRSESCTVRFDPKGERIASKQHAFIEAKPDGYYLTDNQSTNGTLLNGTRVEAAKLNSGDVIQFGKNGVKGVVRIDFPAPQDVTRESFRAAELNDFAQAARFEPDNFQNSMSNIGLGQIEVRPDPETRSTRSYIGIAIGILAIIFLSLVVSLLITTTLSATEDAPFSLTIEGIIFAVLASVVAFLPAVFYLLPMIWLDRYDPEPAWLIALAFAWGALVAVIASFIINTVVGVGVSAAIGGREGMILGNVVSAVISAPVVEEGSKGIGLLILLIFFRRYFDDILDGIVFAGVIALGFATVENVLYYGSGMKAGGSNALIALFVVRGIMSPFAHVTFTAMTGIGCGISRESHNKLVRIIMPVLGYFGAVTMHAIWNGMAVIGGLGGFVIGYIVIEIPFFLIFVGFSFWVMYRQSKILKEMLAIDIARGLIPADHGEKAMSAFKSSGWLIGGLFSGKFRPRSN
ncbi:MAG: PrsW family glutamic-type intramembrane protease, partial [Acidobacteriota bacterium]